MHIIFLHVLGQALLHVMEENMRPKAGARSDAPFFLVLLTDGKSQDDAITAANRLKSAGVEIIAVGKTEIKRELGVETKYP